MDARAGAPAPSRPADSTSVEIEDNDVLEPDHSKEDSLSAKVVETDGFLYFCFCLSLVTAISALLCAVVNIISATRSFSNGQYVFEGILRCYGVFIAIFVALAETEWEWIYRMWGVLEYWVGRGMLQCFVAVLTEAMADLTGGSSAEGAFHAIVSYMLLGCGAFYSIAGLLCVGNLKRRRQHQAQVRGQAAKDLADLEQRRKELQRLLESRH